MGNWWSSLDAFERCFMYFAVPSSILFLVQMILAFIGLDSNLAEEIDFDGDVFEEIRIFTIRNFLSFFMIFGWAGITFYNYNLRKPIVILLAFVFGLLATILITYLFYLIMKLGKSGNVDLNNAIGFTGTVYLSVPARKAGYGKIQIVFQSALREIKAITEGEKISVGCSVVVTDVFNDMLVVEKIN